MPVDEDCDIGDFKDFYDLAIEHIIDCGAFTFKSSPALKKYYIEEQNKYLIETLYEALNPYQRMSFKEYCNKTKANIQGE